MKIIILLFLAFVAFLGSVRGDQEEVPKVRMNGRVRLNNQGFTNTNAGIVEVYFRGGWGMVCADSNVDMKMANVVCRQMGFDLAVELAQPDGYFDDSFDPNEKVWHNVLKCNGDEDTIRDCQLVGSLGTPGQTESSCPRSSYAAVVCGVIMNGFFKVDGVTGMRRMFYAVTPNETSFRTLDEVPEYIIEAAPFFFISVIIEEVYLRYHDGGKDDRFADSITSLIAGMFMVITGLFTKAIELGIYVYVFDNFCIYELPWDSVWTWLFGFLAIDLGYYWFHRMSHEVNIFWASHQVHHSSEEFNLTTALRQPIFEKCYIWIFYIPLAFFLPPPSMLVHSQFNTIYQFWIHTEIIENLGPLEYILNTPSHHRVHHGRNRYCIDKNYAGTLIVWDRLFGTFAEEDERVAYGLVHPITTYNPISLQFCHLQWMLRVFWSAPGLMNKISVIIKGPGWEPGKPRTGLIEDIPDICGPELNKFKTTIPRWMRAYILFHFAINFVLYQMFIDHHTELSPVLVLAVMLYQIYTFTCIGMLCNLKAWWNILAEMMRCALVFAFTTFLIHQDGELVYALLFLQMIYGLSMVFWFVHNRFPNDGTKCKVK